MMGNHKVDKHIHLSEVNDAIYSQLNILNTVLALNLIPRVKHNKCKKLKKYIIKCIIYNNTPQCKHGHSIVLINNIALTCQLTIGLPFD